METLLLRLYSGSEVTYSELMDHVTPWLLRNAFCLSNKTDPTGIMNDTKVMILQDPYYKDDDFGHTILVLRASRETCAMITHYLSSTQKDLLPSLVWTNIDGDEQKLRIEMVSF